MLEQLILNGIIAGSIYSLVALGFAFIFQTTRFFHFAHGAIYTFGAYTSSSLSACFAYLFSIQFGLDRYIAFPIACLATMLIGVGLEVLIYKPMRQRKATDFTLLILHYRTYL